MAEAAAAEAAAAAPAADAATGINQVSHKQPPHVHNSTRLSPRHVLRIPVRFMAWYVSNTLKCACGTTPGRLLVKFVGTRNSLRNCAHSDVVKCASSALNSTLRLGVLCTGSGGRQLHAVGVGHAAWRGPQRPVGAIAAPSPGATRDSPSLQEHELT
eukprot:1195036-Prorocentrum_minimum.AAC.8